MAFRQLHYTSCQDGPSGYSGYQFCAVTSGTPPAVLREVEELTVYHPPPWLLASPCPDEPEVYPVVLAHAHSAATGAAITAQVVFAGTDYSGRPGNYFAHALVTATPEQDFASVLPAELWSSPLWQRHPAGGFELPELAGPPARGIVDPPGVQAFLDAHGAEDILGELLTAVGQSLAGAPSVLLACHDATETAWWIAAVSYLLGGRLSRQLTFTTYSHRPDAAAFHLIGTLADALPRDAAVSFQLFELTSGRAPGRVVHPLARLLVDTGVLTAAALWRQALAFASGTEQSLDDWLPVVAVAAALLGRSLAPAERQAVAGWAGGAISGLPVDVADVVFGVVLTQLYQDLTEDQLIRLCGLAERGGMPARVAHLEDLLIEETVRRIASNRPIAAVRLTSRGASAASERAVQLLDTAPARIALAVLDWAAAWAMSLPEEALAQYGESYPTEEAQAPELDRLLRRSPAVRHGLLARLNTEPPEVAEAALAGPVGAGLQREDLVTYPALAELWLLWSAEQGRIPPLRVLDEIVDARGWAGRSPRVDLELLTRLWPIGCPPDQLADLLGVVDDEPPDEAVEWLTQQISVQVARAEPGAAWYRLAEHMASHPIRSRLPEPDRRFIEDTAQAARLLRGLPVLLASAAPLGPALRDCSDQAALALGRELEVRLAAVPANVDLAVRVFTAQADPDVAAQPVLVSHLADAAEPVRRWRPRDLGRLSRALDSEPAAAELFRSWSRRARPARFRRRPS